MDGRTIPPRPRAADEMKVSSPAAPAARCLDCNAVWHSTLLLDGLRLIGTCPRCGGGTLEFRDAATSAESGPASAKADKAAAGPHLVMGVPRR